jgi:hypothetical protein
MIDFVAGFSWPVPRAFSSPLNLCRFEQGDILYDNRIAYLTTWSEAVKELHYAIQVKTPERGQQTSNEESAVFEANWNSTVQLELSDYKKKTSNRIQTTQGRLYRALWRGSIEHLTSDECPVPFRWNRLLGWFKEAEEADSAGFKRLRGRVLGLKHSYSVLLPGDSESPLTLQKIRDITAQFAFLGCDTVQLRASELCEVEFSSYMPTTQFTIFNVEAPHRDYLLEALKRVLYKPVPGKETVKDRFKLSAHCLILEKKKLEGAQTAFELTERAEIVPPAAA